MCIRVLLGCLLVAQAAVAAQFSVVRLNLAGSQRSSRTETQYIYSVEIWNDGAATKGVVATVSSSSPHTTVVDGTVDFGNVRARESTLSKGTFTVVQDRTQPFDPGTLSFEFRSGNRPPVARPGPDRVVRPGENVTLDGTASYDPDGDRLWYEWKVKAVPGGTPAPIYDPAAAELTFIVPAAAVYQVSLTVTDGQLRSAPAVAFVRAGPVADPGEDQTVQAGGTVALNAKRSFDPKGDPLTYRWTLAAPAGSKARLNNDGSPTPTFVADSPGEYLAALSVSDGVANSTSESVVVTAVSSGMVCGSLMSGVIDQAAQVLSYTFSGQVNQMITLTLANKSGFWPQTARAVVYKPSGGPPWVTFNANSQQQLTLPEAGTYTVRVQASDLVAKGQFNLGLECRRPAGGVDAGVACGSLISGSIAAPGEVDQITFSGQAGQLVTLTLVNTSGFWPQTASATVFSPAGTVFTRINANSQQQLSLPAAGTYVIQVYASDLVATGAYNVGFECRRPVSPVDYAIGCGGLISGNIGAPGEVDQIVFQGNANDRTTLTLANTSGFWPQTANVTVFAPSGAVVTQFAANGQKQLTLPESGTYVIQVRASDFVAKGGYNLGFECPYPIDPPLSCGVLVSGSIAAAAEVDQMALLGIGGQTITVTLGNTSGFWPQTAWATVLGPTGATVLQFGANSQQHLTLPQSGIYVFQVRASDFVAKGGYNLDIECRRPASPVDGSLGCGTLLSNAISATAEVDQFTFGGQANQMVTLTLANTSGFWPQTAVGRVYNPDGSFLVQLNGNGQQQLKLPQAGTYVVQVQASDYVAKGGYNIGLECRYPTPSPARAMACGALLPDSIASAGEVDQFTFAGQANQMVTLTLANTSGFWPQTALARVFKPDGNPLVQWGANSQQQLTLPLAGTYLVQVQASDLVAKGGYNIGLECRRPTPSPVRALSCGALLSDTIASPAEVDQFTIAAVANQQVTLTLANTSGFWPQTAVARVSSPSGDTELVRFGANGQQHLTFAQAGVYLIQVQASDLAATGGYNIGLECRRPVSPVDDTLACNGGPKAHAISAAAQVDQLTFSGRAGQSATLTIANSSGFWPQTSVATVFAPSGSRLTPSLAAAGSRQYPLTQTGIYVIQVQASDLAAKGGYSTSLQCP